MKVGKCKTEDMCVNEKGSKGTILSQGVKLKVAKMNAFKYLGSAVQSNGTGDMGGEKQDTGRMPMVWMEKDARRVKGYQQK